MAFPHQWRLARIDNHAEQGRHRVAIACDAELKAFEHALGVLSDMEIGAANAMADLAFGPDFIPRILAARMRALQAVAADHGPLAGRERKAS
jgi:hypothetical protein